MAIFNYTCNTFHNLKILWTLIFFLFALNLISAWPYQLNLSDGTLIDLNASDNMTTNLTIYILNYTYQNITLQNITDITIQNITNITCINCTYVYNNQINESYYNESYYNKTEADSKFVTLTEYNSYKLAITYPYLTREEFNSTIASLNDTINDKNITISNGWLWTFVIFAFILSIIAIGYTVLNS